MWCSSIHDFFFINRRTNRPAVKPFRIEFFEARFLFSKKGSSRDNFPGSWAPDSSREASQHAAGNVVHPAACISFVISVEPHTHSANSYLRALTTYLAACYAIRDAYIYIYIYGKFTLLQTSFHSTPRVSKLPSAKLTVATLHATSGLSTVLYCTVSIRPIVSGSLGKIYDARIPRNNVSTESNALG